LFDKSASVIENDDRVRGCYFKGENLWFNSDVSGPTSDDTTRSSICYNATATTTLEMSTTDETTLIEETSALTTFTSEESTSTATETTAASTSSTIEPTVEDTPEADTTAIVGPPGEIGETSSLEPLETTADLTTAEPAAVLFSLSALSRCRTVNQTVLTSAECVQAAEMLQLSDLTVQEIENVERPYGCYFKADARQEDGKLWLNTHPESVKRDHDNSRQSLCHGDGAMFLESHAATKLHMLSISLLVAFLLL